MDCLNRTIFTTPGVKQIMGLLSRFLLWIGGWRVEGEKPDLDKYVLIAAPHTSNWDFYYAVLMAFAFDLELYMFGKKELVAHPLGCVMRWMGVVPVDRKVRGGLVDQAVRQFDKRKKMVLGIPPSGTRSRVAKWKTGFYYIATGANLPICLASIDYSKKLGRMGPLFYPTGDLEADMVEILKFYDGVTGKRQENALNA